MIATALPGPKVEEQLQRWGYSTETEEDIQAILNDDGYAIRKLGLRFLVERQGEETA